MSVNRGFFFSNPTSFPAENEDERSIDVSSGIAASNDGSISGAAMPYNFNTNFNCGSYQPMSSMSVNNLNAGNAVMNYNSNNVNGDINLGNIANNMGINANAGFPTNNNFYGNQNNMANNASYNNMGAHNVQNVQNFNAGFVQDVRNTQNTKFGGFFFNPLSIFTNNNSNATVFNNNNLGLINTSAITNNNTLGENNALTSNTIYTNAVMNSNPLGVYQQNPPVQMNFKSVSTSPAFQNDQYATSDSPIPMAFLTPNQGPTPCPTPPAVLKSPMFLDAYSYPPPSDVSVNQNSNNSNDWNQVEATQETNNTHTQETIAPSKGLFRRGISTVGSALGTVATYVNQSFLSGIPFHIADRALKESKETYAKWWEDGINAHKGKKRMGGTNSGDSSGDNDEDDNAERDGSDRQLGKKRKLDSSEAAGVCGTGSALSISLEKNYNDLGIDTSSKFFGYPQQQQHQNQFISSSQSTKVDSSIIKSRRRSQFEHKRASHASSVKQEEPVFPDDWSSGYNVFNNIGGMYDFGEENDGGVESENGCTEGDIGEYSTYDSLGDYYTTNEHDDQDNEVSTAHALSKSNAATITSTLDGTMQIIAELLEEKNRASEENEMLQMVSNPRNWVKKSIRSELIDALQSAHGDVKDKRFLSALEILSNFYKTSGRDARVSPWSGRRVSDPGFDGGEYGYSGNEIGGPTSSDLFEGYWLNMSRPNYVECLGTNMESEFMYTLGRMSFDMFQPSNLICSVQSTHNTIKIIGEREELPAFVPKSLKEEVASLCDSGGDGSANRPLLRSYE